MIKIIKNQLLHRFLRTKSILLIYSLFLCGICIEITSKSSIPLLKTQMKLNVNPSFHMMKESITFYFYIGIIAIVLLCIVKLYKDYKYGAMRWKLVTKYTEGILLGDILFIFMTFVALYVLCYIGLYICTNEVLVSVKKILTQAYTTNPQEIMNRMQDVETIRILFPNNVIEIIANLSALLFVAQMPVYISAFLVKKDQRPIEIVGMVLSLALLLYSIVRVDSLIQIVIYLMFTGIYFYFTWKIKTTMEGAKKHVKD